MPKFQVWVEVEQHNGEDANPEYEKCDLPFAGLITMDTLEEATKFAQHMQDYGELLATEYVSHGTIELYRKLAKDIGGLVKTRRHVFGNIATDSILDDLDKIAHADPE